MALVGREDVDDDRAEVDEDPAAVVVAFRAGDREAGAADRFDDGIGDRPGLDFRAAGDDRERIGDDRAPFEIEKGEVFAFFVFRGIADGCQEIGQSGYLSLSDRILVGRRRGYFRCFEAVLRNTRNSEGRRRGPGLGRDR